MRIALITDIHWGVRKDHTAFIDYFDKFYTNIFFPKLLCNGVTHVILGGDTFDKRKYSNHLTIKAAKRIFFDELRRHKIQTHILIGNHDITFNNTLETNSVSVLLPEYDNIEIIKHPTVAQFDGLDIALVPWICSSNADETMEFLGNAKAEICIGHFEISGFEMYKGQQSSASSSDRLSAKTFERFDMVFSGHYHHKSTQGNITYLGTPYEMTWHDYDDPKGFHLFDTDTRQLEFVPNPYKMFVRVDYNDQDQEPVDLDAIALENTYVKVFVINKTNFPKFEQFMAKMHTKGCHDIKVIEDMREYESSVTEEAVTTNNTGEVLDKYIDTLGFDANKELVKDFVKGLYLEALMLEDL